MASEYHDIFKPQPEQFAYLKCPDKISRALVNAGGPRLSADVIKRRLSRLSTKVEGAHIGDPTESDGIDFRVAGLVPQRVVSKTSTARELQMERNRIAALAALVPDRSDKKPVPVENVRVRQPIPKAAFDLIERVCGEFGLTDEQFYAPRRQGLIFAARALVAVVLHERNPLVYSYVRLADVLGRKDHTTIMHNVKRFDVCCQQFPQVAALYLKLREEGK